MSAAPSLPLILFAVADAVARGGMPDPAEVRVDDHRALRLDFAGNEPDARRWAEAAGIDLTSRWQWMTQPYTGPAGSSIEGQQFTLINGHGKWNDIRLHITVLVPVEQPAQVAS